MILQTMCLTIMIIYIFSCWGFLSLDQYFQPNNDKYFWGQELSILFLSSIHYGLTLGGGIGDALRGFPIYSNESKYWEKWVF